MIALIARFCLSVFVVQAVIAQTVNFEGNVRFAFDTTGNQDYEGILEVYSQGDWNAVCLELNGTNVTNYGAAVAACRQKKHRTADSFGSATKLGYSFPDGQQPNQAITGIECPEVKFPATEGDIFLMRCDNSDQLIPSQQCNEFVGIKCSTTHSGDQPYNGQIRRESDGDRTELLQINFDSTWLPVCTKNMSNSAADAVCRQLGFTSSSQSPIPSINKDQRSWKIDDLTDCTTSFPCFTDCIQPTVGYTSVEHCDEYQYEVFCQFDKSLDGVFSAGNKFICNYHDEKSTALLDVGIAAIVILALVIVIGPVISILLISIKCYKLGRRNGYNEIPGNVRPVDQGVQHGAQRDEDEDQPNQPNQQNDQ